MEINMDKRIQNIGWKIRKIREEKGYTIECVAELAEISVAHLQRIETSKKGMSLTCLYKIADVLEVPQESLLADSKIQSCYDNGLQNLLFLSEEESCYWKEVIECVKKIKIKYRLQENNDGILL